MTVAGDNDMALVIADAWQRGFPLNPRPFKTIAARHGLDERSVLALLSDLAARGVLARIGAAVRPNTAGASTLAAIAAPVDQIDTIAAMINAEPCVNHNYERQHAFNIWFVVTAPDSGVLTATLERIATTTGRKVLNLPLERAYHIDLGFSLNDTGAAKPATGVGVGRLASTRERQLLSALEDGLAITTRPYQMIAQRLGWSEAEVLSRLGDLVADGIISRFGCIIRHRRLGYTANAMAVWNVPDDRVDAIAERLARRPHVTLCYRRRRAEPDWPYNLFAMVHGRDRDRVTSLVAEDSLATGLNAFDGAVLFSTRCFKQTGARFSPQRAGAA